MIRANHLLKLAFIFTSLTSALVADETTLPEPYCSINDLPFDPQGWFSNQTQLDSCISEINPQTVIEVGSWLGASTRFIAERLPENSKLYAVDTWLGSNEASHKKDPRLPYLYQLFLSNVKHAQLTDVIIPVRMNSVEASKALNVNADLIYIDGAHDSVSVYNDVIAWYPHLNEGGIICGDDWSWASARQGVMRAAAELNCTISAEGNFWRLIPQ